MVSMAAPFFYVKPAIEMYLDELDPEWKTMLRLDHSAKIAFFYPKYNECRDVSIANLFKQSGWRVMSDVSPIEYRIITIEGSESVMYELTNTEDGIISREEGVLVIRGLIESAHVTDSVVRLRLTCPVNKNITSFIAKCFEIGAKAVIVHSELWTDYQFAHKRFYINPSYPLTMEFTIPRRR